MSTDSWTGIDLSEASAYKNSEVMENKSSKVNKECCDKCFNYEIMKPKKPWCENTFCLCHSTTPQQGIEGTAGEYPTPDTIEEEIKAIGVGYGTLKIIPQVEEEKEKLDEDLLKAYPSLSRKTYSPQQENIEWGKEFVKICEENDIWWVDDDAKWNVGNNIDFIDRLKSLLAEHEAELWQKIEGYRKSVPKDPLDMTFREQMSQTIQPIYRPYVSNEESYNQALSDVQLLLNNKK